MIVPYANSVEGMYPEHHIFLTEKWFEQNLHFQQRFKITSVQFKKSDYFNEFPLWARILFPFEKARLFFFNVCSEM